MTDLPTYNPWGAPIFPGDTAPQPYENYASPPVANLLSSIAGALGKAFMAPGQALQSTTPITSDQMIAPAMGMAGLAMTGGVGGAPAASGEALLGSGAVRKLPADNYLGPISKHTDTLYREMSPTEALSDLPTSVSNSSGGLGGSRKFYADHPDLALGQGGNKGVRVEYDSTPFEGTINRQKPAWDLGYQNGMAEYLAAPKVGANIRDAVRSFEIDPSTLSRVEGAQYQRLLTNLKDLGWSVGEKNGKITAAMPGTK
jgi:hypothetical protein